MSYTNIRLPYNLTDLHNHPITQSGDVWQITWLTIGVDW